MSEDDIFRFLTTLGRAHLRRRRRRPGSRPHSRLADRRRRSSATSSSARPTAPTPACCCPGIIATGVLGAIWGIRAEAVDPIETGWLLAVEILYLVSLFVLVPGMFAGVRRVRLLSLQARKTGQISDELTDALNDRGPLVFAILMAILLPVQVALVTLQP